MSFDRMPPARFLQTIEPRASALANFHHQKDERGSRIRGHEMLGEKCECDASGARHPLDIAAALVEVGAHHMGEHFLAFTPVCRDFALAFVDRHDFHDVLPSAARRVTIALPAVSISALSVLIDRGANDLFPFGFAEGPFRVDEMAADLFVSAVKLALVTTFGAAIGRALGRVLVLVEEPFDHPLDDGDRFIRLGFSRVFPAKRRSVV
jgi:hypothetical protein